MEKDVQKACDKVGLVLADLINPLENGIDMTSASMAVSMATMTVTASCLMDDFNPYEGKVPKADHILFAALLVWAATHLEPSGRLAVEFSPSIIRETMDHYEKFTGQNARPILNPSLMSIVDQSTRVNPKDFGPNSQFLPN